MNFSIGFLNQTNALFKEAFKFKKYKAMPLGWAIIVGIIMAPFMLLNLIFAALLYVLSYIFDIIAMPINSLYKVLHAEGQSVMHATQFILYLLSWPLIFTAYAWQSILVIFSTILYSINAILVYAWTFGGIKFHVFVSQAESIEIETNGKYNQLLPAILVAATAVIMIILPLISTISTCAEIGFDYLKFSTIMNIFKFEILQRRSLSMLVSFLYSVLIMARFPRKK